MSYRLDFTGVVSPDINHLLNAIEHRLNDHASALLAGEDLPAAVTELKLGPCAKGQRPPCFDPNSNPREPWVIVHGSALLVIAFALGVAVGLGAGTMLALGRMKGR